MPSTKPSSSKKKKHQKPKQKLKPKAYQSKYHRAIRYLKPKKRSNRPKDMLLRFTQSHWYVLCALCVLLVTTAYWSVLGALVQSENADELIYPSLMSSPTTFSHAVLPAAHTFLMKWPLFWLQQALGNSVTTRAVLTMILCLCTAGLFAYLLLRLEKRPAYVGTYLLLLSSVLLTIPAQPYAGALLPVSMAMLATRNIEYAFFIGGLIAALRARKLVSWQSGVAFTLLTLLLASDRLFLIIGVVGAFLAAAAAVFSRQKQLKGYAMVGIVLLASYIAATLLVFGISHLSGITIAAASGPFGVIKSVKQLRLGIFFGSLHLATNLGANPAYDALLARSIPTLVKQRLGSIAGIAFICNLAVFGVGLYASIRLLLGKIGKKALKAPKTSPSAAWQKHLAYILIGVTMASFLSYIASDHYYVVDARYLAIILPTLFVALAVYWSGKNVRNRILLSVAFAAVCSIGGGMQAAYAQYASSTAAISSVDANNKKVLSLMEGRQLTTLMGDYWRVLPIQNSNPTIHVVPLDDCTAQRQVLTSTVWQINPAKDSFAYLLSYQKGLAGFPACNIEDIIKAYGTPNASLLVSGTNDQPLERLLIFDRSAHAHSQTSNNTDTTTVEPVSLSSLQRPNCTGVHKVMQIVAHEDDDLLFMSPDMIHHVQNHDCLRTVYITAGDAGLGDSYWLGREKGAQAAYASLLGIPGSVWQDHIIKLQPNEFVTLSNPQRMHHVSLVFMHLPDGNIQGGGFPGYGFQSVQKLYLGYIEQLSSVDRQSSYTRAELVNALKSIIDDFQPDIVHLQQQGGTEGVSAIPDHSDHDFSARLASEALQAAQLSSPPEIITYQGYGIKRYATNLSDEDIREKLHTFLAYSAFDPHVCANEQSCLGRDTNYSSYIERQYYTP